MTKTWIATAIATTLLAAAGGANAAVDIGDSLEFYLSIYAVNYADPYLKVADFTYSGPGQTENLYCNCGNLSSFGAATVSRDQIVFSTFAFFIYPTSAFTGLVVVDQSNASAFNGWTVLADTVGIEGHVLAGDTAAVNVQDLTVRGNVTVGVVPEPSTWAMMLLGVGSAGAGLRARRRNVAA